jgi:hypothetical protein
MLHSVVFSSLLLWTAHGFAALKIRNGGVGIRSHHLSRKSITRRPTFLSMNVIENEVPKEIRVGVIGCGRIGLVHLEAITKAPGVRAVIVSNPTVSKAEKGKRRRN